MSAEELLALFKNYLARHKKLWEVAMVEFAKDPALVHSWNQGHGALLAIEDMEGYIENIESEIKLAKKL